MSSNIEKHNIFIEDNKKNVYYPYTQKTNVMGLIHPDNYIENVSKVKYAKIARLSYIKTNVYINETFSMILINNDPDTGYLNSDTYDIHIEGNINASGVIEKSIICTCTSNNNLITNENVKIILRSDFYSSGTKTISCLDVWVESENIDAICINRVYSLSSNTTPDKDAGTEHIDSSYESLFYSTNNIPADSFTNNDEIMMINRVAESCDSNQKIINKVQDMIDNNSNFKYSTISYKEKYIPQSIGTEEIISPYFLHTKEPAIEDFLILQDGYFTVKENGMYQFQLKHGILVDGGTSSIQLQMYKNNLVLAELTLVNKLEENKKYSTASGFVVVPISTDDRIYLKSSYWVDSGNPTVIVNHSLLQILKLTGTEGMDTIPLGIKLNKPYIGMARVDKSKVKEGIVETGDIYSSGVDFGGVGFSEIE